MTRVDRAVVFFSNLPEFEYYRPKTIEEAVELLSKYGEDARVLAGGTDLIQDLRMRAKRAKVVIDIKGIPELHRVEYVEGQELVVGATVTLNELIENKIVKEKYYALWEALKQMADYHLRNRATLVGNICNASPAADSAPPLLVFGAEVEVASKEGVRRIPLKDFFAGVKRTVLKPGEFVTAIIIPEPPAGTRSRYVKITRSSEDLAVVGIAGLAANIDMPDKRVVRLAYASVAPTPLLIEEVEEVFRKDRPLSELVEDAVKTVMSRVSPITDVRATREYRLHVIEFGTRYVLKELLRG